MKKYLPWTLRIVISFLFLLSAVAKMINFSKTGEMMPSIWMFEKQIVDLGITDWCTSPYLARLIIALELAIGFAVLQKHFLKRLVIPVTLLLLVAFCIHLGSQIAQFGANNGNCGCFGQLIPMTPLEALIKNIITIGLIVYLYFLVEEKPKGENKFLVPFSIYGFSALFMFAFFPFCPCEKEESAMEGTVQEIGISETVIEEEIDTTIHTTAIDTTGGMPAVVQPVEAEPASVVSKFGKIKVIGGKAVNLDKGKKIVCCFAPGCEHCRDTAKQLAEMSKKSKLPPVYILFMDEETNLIPEFFSFSGLKAAYNVVDIREFWTLMGNDNTPAVHYLWNGNVRYHSEGTEGAAFNAEALKKALEGL